MRYCARSLWVTRTQAKFSFAHDKLTLSRPLAVIYLYQSLALAPYFNWVESAPARELFDFQNPESVAAIKFLEA